MGPKAVATRETHTHLGFYRHREQGYSGNEGHVLVVHD